MSEVFPINADPRFRLSTAVGGETSYSVPFPFQDNDDIEIWRFANADDLTGTKLSEGVHYSLTGAGSPSGGTATLVTAATAGQRYLRMGKAVIARVLSVVRDGRFKSEAIDEDIDRFIIIAQELSRDLGQAVRVPLGSSVAELPAPEPDKFWKWNAAGTGVEFVDILNSGELAVSAYMQTLLGSADANTVLESLGLDDIDTRFDAIEDRLLDDFATVALLLADATMSYTTGNRIMIAGDIVTAGGFRYIVVASDATLIASNNLSGYHVITAGGIKLKVVKVNDHYNVKAFGAKGDNATADHGPIQRTIWALGTPGGRVLFPMGNYRISARLLPTPNCAGLQLVGEGFRACALVWDGNAGGSNRIMVHLTDDLDNCVIEGLNFENLGDAQIAIFIECVRVTMRRLFANPTVKFLTHIIATSTTITTYNVTMDDVHLFSSALGQEHDVAVNIARGHTFNARACLFSGHKIALRVGNSSTLVGANIDGCRFETFSGIDTGYPGATNATGLQLGEVWGASITGCNFEMASDQNAAGGAHRGIRMNNVKGVSVRGNVFQGQGVALSGIDLSDANAAGIMIDGNAFYRLASANRVSVSGTGDLASAVITGNPLFS